MNPMKNAPTLPAESQAALDRAVSTLAGTLGANLHSLVLYGSAVRAWEEFAASDACPADLRPLIAEALAQQ